MMLLVALGAAAGFLTTVSGAGGGMLLVIALAAVWDPLTALVISSLALLAGNVHRVVLFRSAIRARLVIPLVAGAVPASVVGALVAASLPVWLLQAAIVAVAALAAIAAMTGTRLRLPVRALAPGAVAVGTLSATTGGGGFLLGPLVLATGVSGATYVATCTTTAVTVHIGRIIGYAVAGLIDASAIAEAAGIAAAIVSGNLAGHYARGRLSCAQLRGAELVTPAVCAAIALVSTLL